MIVFLKHNFYLTSTHSLSTILLLIPYSNIYLPTGLRKCRIFICNKLLFGGTEYTRERNINFTLET